MKTGLPVAIVSVLLLAAACGGGNARPTPTQPAATPTPVSTPTPSPTATASPTLEPSPTPTAEEILRRSDEAMTQLDSVRVTVIYRQDDTPFYNPGENHTLVFDEVEPVRLDSIRQFGGARVATNVTIEGEENHEGQLVWVISYEFGFQGIDSDDSVWRMEWIARDSFLLLRQEELYHSSPPLIEGHIPLGAVEEYSVRVLSDFKGEPGVIGANIGSTDGLLFDGTISGVRVFDAVAWEEAGSPPQKDCDMEGANPQPVSLAESVGTPLEINPTYLPAGVSEWTLNLSDSLGPPATVCGGQVSGAKRMYAAPAGLISIEKWRGPNLYVGNLLAEYVSAGEISGEPAIFVRRTEVVPHEGLGDAILWATEGRVIIPEEFGFTVVRITGPNFPFEEAVKIAEGLE